MQKQSSKKQIIIIAVIILAALGAYFYFSGSPDASSTSSLSADGTPQSTDSSNAGAEVLSLLNQISSIHIDTTFFQDPAYKSLVDHTVVVPEQNVGRTNPFVPVPGTFISSQPSAK